MDSAISQENLEGPFVLSVLKHLDCPIIVTDARKPDNPIIFVNQAYLLMSGYEEAEVLGKNPRFMHGNHSNQPALAKFRRSIQNVEPCSVHVVNTRKDRTEYSCEVLIRPIHSETDGKVSHWIGVQRNITAETSMEIWSALLAHDLKNPLLGVARILGQMADGLLGSVSDDQRHALLACRQENYRALGTLTDMLTLYRTFQKKLPFESPQRSCIEEVILSVVQNIQSYADSKATICFAPSLIKSYVMIPKSAMTHALNNLIDNALKYSRNECVTVKTIRLDENSVRIEVENDSAIPLPENLFELPLDGIGNSRGWSTQLGLFLTKRMLELNGGSIEYINKDNSVTFSVILPLTH